MVMQTATELYRVNQWIWDVLSGDSYLQAWTGGRIFIDQAPQGTTGLMIIAAYLGGSDNILTTQRRLTRMLYLIRAISEGASYDLVAPTADRIEALLTVQDTGTVVNDVRISACFRQEPHQRKDAESGVPIIYMGGVYRIIAQPAYQ